MPFVKPKPIPLIVTTVGVVLMMVLGTWQVKRLMWKESLISTIEEVNEKAPLQILPNDKAELQEKRFYRVQLNGEYMAQPEFHIAARYYLSQLGYHLLNPFKLEDGRMVLVNRGWIPTQKKEQGAHPAAPVGPTTILAQIRTSNERNPFTPENQPEKNVWFGRDVEQMAQAAELEFVPVTLDLIGEQQWDQHPVPSTGKIELRNDHLGYAVTWYGIGLGILIVSLVYHRKKPEDA